MQTTTDNHASGTERRRIPGDPVTDTMSSERLYTLRGMPSLSTIGIVAITMTMGYEWFVSGLVKFVRGGYPAGRANELLEQPDGARSPPTA